MRRLRLTRWNFCFAIAAALVLCTRALGQTSPQLPSPSSPSTSVDAATKAAAQDLQKKKSVVEILSDPEGVDFSRYLHDALSKIRQNWYAAIPAGETTKKSKLAIEFAITKDGKIADMKQVATAGDVPLDRAAWNGIVSSQPFPALPEAFHGPYLALRLRFFYNPDKSDLDGTAPSAPASLAPQLPSQPIKARSRVEMLSVLSENRDFDLHPYLEDKVLPLIQANWYRLASKSGEKAGGDATVEFTILKDGSLSGTKLTDGAGHAVLGDLALSAITKSAPFAAPPAEFTGSSVSVRARFLYEPGISSQGSSVEGQSSLTSPFYANVDGVDGPVYRIIGGISPPRVIHQIDPEFSEEARKKKVSGTVELSIVVTSKGDVSAVRVTTSLGSGLDEKAIEAVRQWKFKPATKDGEHVSAEIAVIISFNLAKDGTNGR